MGSDSVAVTQKAVDAYTAAWDARSIAQLGPLYARDIVFDYHATGVHVDGRSAFLKLMGNVCCKLPVAAGDATRLRAAPPAASR